MDKIVTREFRNQEAAIGILQAIIDAVKNPKSIKDAADALVKANSLTDEQLKKAVEADKSIKELQRTLDQIEKEKKELSIREKNLAVAKDAYEQDIIKLKTLRSEVDSINESAREKTKELDQREISVKNQEDQLAKKQDDFREREKELMAHSIAVKAREDKIRSALS